jgi:saccharopine dehydrogenase-like NADP-dependent oxidoreductase
MRIVLLGGAGAMASGALRDLVASCAPGSHAFVVADTDFDRASRLVLEVGNGQACPAKVDVSDTLELNAIIAAADLCINAVPTYAGHQMRIFDACFSQGRIYVDFGGMGVFTLEQKKQCERWRQAGLTAVLGLGADPGISNMICKAVAERLDTIDRINLYWAAARLGPESPVLVPPYAISTLLAEFANKSWQFLDGALREVPPRSGHETLGLPAPWGSTEFIYTQHSEPLTVPFAKGFRDKGIREFTWKLHLPPEEHAAWIGLVKAGFNDFNSVLNVDGALISPVSFLQALIKRNVEKYADKIPASETHEVRLAIGHGEKNGRKFATNQAVIVRPHPSYDGYVDPATSMGLSIGVQLLLQQDRKPGVWGPEEYFDVPPFLRELERRHFSVVADMEVEQTWSADRGVRA